MIALAALIAAAAGSARRTRWAGSARIPASLFSDAAGATTIIALLFGLTIVTDEFRYGTIMPALLTTPRRPVFCFQASRGQRLGLHARADGHRRRIECRVVWLGLIDVPIELGEAAEPVARMLVAALVAGSMGAAYGGIMQRQVRALVGALIWLLVAEPLLIAVLDVLDVPAVGDYLPAMALFAIADPQAKGSTSCRPRLVGLGHIALALTAAVVRTERRDIT